MARYQAYYPQTHTVPALCTAPVHSFHYDVCAVCATGTTVDETAFILAARGLPKPARDAHLPHARRADAQGLQQAQRLSQAARRGLREGDDDLGS